MGEYIKRIKNLFNTNNSQTITVRILELYYNNSKNQVEITFETKEGIKSTAVLEFNSKEHNNEFIQFTQSTDKFEKDDLTQLINNEVNINLNEFPQFYNECTKTPDGFVISAANHPDVVSKTREYEKDKNPSMEELLYERIRLLNGVSDNEARKMANEEAKKMGELSALKTAKMYKYSQ